jgi:hypothetical protein
VRVDAGLLLLHFPIRLRGLLLRALPSRAASEIDKKNRPRQSESVRHFT